MTTPDSSDPSSRTNILEELLQEIFSPDVVPYFTRTSIKGPVLAQTGEELKQDALAVWKVILKFMGDVTDYRNQNNTVYTPGRGSVVTRLSERLGILWSSRDKKRKQILIQDVNQKELVENQKELGEGVTDTDSTLGESHQPSRKRGFTVKRLKSTLRFWRSNTSTALQSLRIEDTLNDRLDQLHFICAYGILLPPIRDEIYAQVCKQLVKNPFKSSASRGWLLMYHCASCFTPSEPFMKYLKAFLNNGPSMSTRPIQKALQRTKTNSNRWQPPCSLEIEAAQERKLLELEITTMDGAVHTVRCDAATTSREICEHLDRKLALRSPSGFAVFIAMYDQVASLGNGNDHVFDALSQCEQINREQEVRLGATIQAPWRLYYRKELFLPWELAKHDMVSTHLVYSQIVRGIMMGEYVFNKNSDMSSIAAQHYYVEYGSEIDEASLDPLTSYYIPEKERLDENIVKEWKCAVIKYHNKLFPVPDANSNGSNGNGLPQLPEVDLVKQNIVMFAKRSWPIVFSRFYDVSRSGIDEWNDCFEEELTLAVNWMGVFLMEGVKISEKFLYEEIESVQLDSNVPQVVTIITVDKTSTKLICADAADMQNLIVSHIDGLRKRSVYAIFLNSTEELQEENNELVILDSPYNNRDGKLKCRNLSTNVSSEIDTSSLHILSTLKLPSINTLRRYKADSPANIDALHKLKNKPTIGDTYLSTKKRSESKRSAPKPPLPDNTSNEEAVSGTPVTTGHPDLVESDRESLASSSLPSTSLDQQSDHNEADDDTSYLSYDDNH